MRAPAVIPAAALIAALAAGGLLRQPVTASEQQEPEPMQSGLTESVGISLIGLDVVVRDEDGRPVRGLTAADFRLLLDQKEWPLYAADDTCACEEGRQTAAAGPAGPGPSPGAAAGAASPPRRLVLYFDFSQMQAPGRASAFRQARRWLRERKRPEDLVMLAAYASEPGLRYLTGFTAQRDTLLGALDALEKDKAFVDSFPLWLESRMRDCASCGGVCEGGGMLSCQACCNGLALEEYHHGQRSLQAARLVMAGLGEHQGPKEVLLFTQSGVLEPHRLYRYVDRSSSMPDLRQDADDLSAAVLTSRVRLSIAFDHGMGLGGSVAEGTAALAGRLAEFTGGRYNRSWADYDDVVDALGGECCFYRLTFQPPDRHRRALYQAVVFAQGRRLPATYRVEFLPERERWFRRATAVLTTPDLPRELRLAGALIPTALEHRRWQIAVRLSLDTGELAVVPSGLDWRNRWEVAALVRGAKGPITELGTTVRIRRGVKAPVAVIRAAVGNVRPGPCTLRGLVGDREENRFGGVQAGLDLPQAGEARVLGPYLLHAVETPLSIAMSGLFEEAQEAGPAPDPLPSTAAPLPDPLRTGETLIAVSLLCGEAAKPWEADGTTPMAEPAAPSRRFLSMDGTPVFRVDAGTVEPAGECVRFIDWVDTSELAPGGYRFHFRWGEAGAEEMSAAFNLAPSP